MSEPQTYPKRKLELIPFNSQLETIDRALANTTKLSVGGGHHQHVPQHQQQAYHRHGNHNQQKYSVPSPASGANGGQNQQQSYLLHHHGKPSLQLSPHGAQSQYLAHNVQTHNVLAHNAQTQFLNHGQYKQPGLNQHQNSHHQAKQLLYSSNYAVSSPVLSMQAVASSPYTSSLDFNNVNLDIPRLISPINKSGSKMYQGGHSSHTMNFGNYGEPSLDSPILMPPGSSVNRKNSPPNLFLSSTGSSPLKSTTNASTPTEPSVNTQFLNSPSLLGGLPNCSNNNWNTASGSIWGNNTNQNSNITSSLGSSMW